ncbi:MAG: hypothetical protein GXO79_10710 [Chlorobi bacterium]|nr:hypothetical protein [Chlorobiota bacterium]
MRKTPSFKLNIKSLFVFRIILSATFFLSVNSLFSQQIKSFSNDTAEFIEQLNDLLYRKDVKRQVDDFMNEFSIFLYQKTFAQNQFERIRKTANKLLKKRAKNYPHFSNYLRSILLFSEYKRDTLDYYYWETALNKKLDTRRESLSKINNYLKITCNLLYENTIYKSSTTQWKASSNNYKIRIVDKNIKIIFDTINITCYAKKDSIKIFNTSGFFDPDLIKWNGQMGVVSWLRSGYPADSVHAKLSNYSINMKRSEYFADSVIFTHKAYFNKPLIGKLQDKVMNITRPEKAAFPRFDSYSKRFEINNIFDNVDYNGGFSMRGAKFIGSGSSQKPAYVYIFRNIEIIEEEDTIVKNILFLKAASLYYVFTANGVVGKNSTVTLKLDNDSIYHPGLMFRYNVSKRQVSLIRSEDDENFSRSLYSNTYHKVDMDFELLTWNIDEPIVYLKTLKGSSVNKALFESENFFSSEKYTRVQGIDRVHPYQALYNFSKKYDAEYFTATEFANYMRISLPQIREQLMRLSYSGVIDYDINTEEVHIKDRLYHYLEARHGKRDYDVIDFQSETEGEKSNAILDLTNFDLQILGVPRIFLSDSQNVVIYPENNKILLKKNRDFNFAGQIEAGLFTYYGQNFAFKYDSFKIDLNKIDSLKLKIIDENIDNWGRQMLVNVKSVIENITGDLLIDDPNNKSGVKSYPEYPIFDSKQNSYVYFDRKEIQKGVYPRDKVYFVIDPYQLDSLDNFSTEGLGFEGTFETSGIIPTIREKLVVQDDNSLGFIHRTPPEGFPLYEGKGNFKNDIQISNHGLSGNGVFHYINSTTYSDDFIFYPDSMNALANQFINEKKEEYPEFPVAYALGTKVHWLPLDDEYFINSREDAIILYDSKAKMNGTLKLEPNGFTGWGTVDYSEGQLTSKLFTYQANTFGADTSDFKLFTHDLTGIALKADNVKSLVNFKRNISEYLSNTKITKIEMPQNKYISYMENFTWYMDRRQVEMKTDIYVTMIERGISQLVKKSQESENPLGSLFVSVHPKQDSLNFISPTATLDLNDYIINAYDVKFIKVADATIYPGDGEIEIKKNAKMQTLTNAEILANDSTKYHRFYNANVNIFGRLSYTGSGKYDYFDELAKKQVIQFDLIGVDDSIQTYAKGKIPQIQKFTLSPVFSYYGNVMLEAKKEYLTFSGYAKIKHECDAIARNWFKFTTEINPNEIYLPLSSELKDNNKKELFSGVMMAKDSVYLIPDFLNPQKNYNDIPIIISNGGYLYYDKGEKKYKISSKEKLADFDLRGNYVSLNRFYCNLYAEGEMNPGVNLGQVKTKMVGNVNYDINKKAVIIDAMLALDFFFAPQAIQIMADTIIDDVTLRAINIARPTYVKGMKEMIGNDLANQLFDEAKLFGQFKKIPDELTHTLFLTDVHLKWNQETSSFQSFGKIGIGSIMKTQINRLVNGHIEIQKKRSGDVISIYLEITPHNWFFFNYKRGLMQAYSASYNFNEVIRGIKASKRKLDVPRGEEQYMFFLSNATRKNQFLRQFEEE